MKQFTVTGMHCAACAAHVEKAVSALDGVRACSVNLLTNTLGVDTDGSLSEEAIQNAVTAAGYGIAAPDNGNTSRQNAALDHALADTETPKLRKRLIASVCVLPVLLYFSMGHTMLSLPVPSFLSENPLGIALCELLLTTVIAYINRSFFENGFAAILRRAPNMDSLVALGASVSYIWGIVSLFSMTVRTDTAEETLHTLTFESAAMILSLITVGKTLEAHAKGKTTNALRGLLSLTPKTAVIIENDIQKEIPVAAVAVGMTFVVRPGAQIPVDGTVVSGESDVNEAALTGESIPIDKTVGSKVSAGCLNGSGVLYCRAERVGEDTALAQIIRLVSDAAATKAPIARLADTVAGYFVPTVCGIALFTFLVWILIGKGADFALTRAIAVLVISCPCALGLATPVAVMVGSGVGAKHGILYKTAASLEAAGRIDYVILDKTGTVTKGEPDVTDIVPASGFTEETLLTLAASLERNSGHPLGKAVVRAGEARSLPSDAVTSFENIAGNGLRAKRGGTDIYGGKRGYLARYAEIPAVLDKKADELAAQGKTPLWFADGNRIAGIIAVADTLKEDSIAAVAALHKMGISVLLLTGDNRQTAQAIGNAIHADAVLAEVLPADKEAVVAGLQKYGKVAMVGDGINDAPALTRADLGIAVGTGTDIAVDAADAVLMQNRLSDVPAALTLGYSVLSDIRENLFWAFFYNLIGIPLAAGIFVPLGITLPPMFGAAAMSLSSFCVVSNALRLNLLNIRKIRKTKREPKPIPETIITMFTKQEEVKMTKTMKIEGMMCGHCEAAVKKALEAVPGVESAVVSHEAGTAVITLSAPVAEDILIGAVTAKDYTVLSLA